MESGTEITTPRFVVDEMLGKLARWLRMMGMDVEHRRPFHDEALLDIARREARIIITRDRKLAAGGSLLEVWLVEEDLPFNQLVEVVRRIGIDLRGKAFTRCGLCNKPLVDVTREEVAGKVPPFVFATQTEYRLCKKCNKIYWPGTHRKRMEEIFDEVARSAALKT